MDDPIVPLLGVAATKVTVLWTHGHWSMLRSNCAGNKGSSQRDSYDPDVEWFTREDERKSVLGLFIIVGYAIKICQCYLFGIELWVEGPELEVQDSPTGRVPP
jgi:hypothetical protein